MSDLYFAYCQGNVLLTADGRIPEGEPPVAFQPWEHVTDIKTHPGPTVKGGSNLRTQEEVPLPSWEGRGGALCHVYRLDRPVTGRNDLQMMGLRKSFEVLSPEMYQLAGKCAELVYWDQNSKFCGCCGAPMRWDTEISKRCTECGKELWPQLQTAIIVRVTRTPCRQGSRDNISPSSLVNDSYKDGAAGDEILMVRAHNFRGSYYGLVAGFVETGETLEECVRREVWEETHILVRDIRYFASQPWPYPAGLMVGFTAEYDGGELQLQRSELASGGWFRRDNLPDIPGPVSLARRLIDDWLLRMH